MQAVNFFFVNALLFASLIAVVGVPVLYVTQPSTEEGQKERMIALMKNLIVIKLLKNKN